MNIIIVAGYILLIAVGVSMFFKYKDRKVANKGSQD